MSRKLVRCRMSEGSRFAVECDDVIGLILLALEPGSESAALKRNFGHR